MNYINIKFIFLCSISYFFSNGLYAGHPCDKAGTGVRSCQEVTQYRANAAKNSAARGISLKYFIEKAKDKEINSQEFKYLNEKLCLGLKSVTDPSLAFFQQNMQKVLEALYAGMTQEEKIEDLKLGFLIATHENYLTVEKKRRQDLSILINEFKTRNINKISEAEVTQGVTDIRNHVDRAMEIMKKSAPEIVTSENHIESYFTIWFPDFVGKAMQKNYENVAPQKKIASFKTDEERFKFLLARAQTTDNGKPYPDGITPYMARMVLTFNMGKKMNVAERDDYAQRMELKYNITKTGNDGNRAIHQKTWAATIFHDGYIYGAPNSAGVNILHPIDDTPKDSCGIDCSLFVQKDLVDIGFKSKDLGGRMTTKGMLDNNYEGRFEKILLCSETQLKPGDIMVKNGHTQIFRGYTDQRPNEFLLYEATGEENRNVRLAQYDLYTEGSDCQQSRFTSNPAKPYYILRLKRLP